jgi:hypothetical protein
LIPVTEKRIPKGRNKAADSQRPRFFRLTYLQHYIQNNFKLWQTGEAMPYWFDGNNLIGQSAAAAKANPRVCRKFLSALGAFRSLRGGKFLVYFDGDDPGHSASPPGIGIKYSAPLSTDEAILRRLHEIQRPFEIIVVTNDRGLLARCRNAGAATMNWSEFDSKMRCSPLPARQKNERPAQVDIEDWLRYFGLDKKDM